jgi:hypothetical protein
VHSACLTRILAARLQINWQAAGNRAACNRVAGYGLPGADGLQAAGLNADKKNKRNAGPTFRFQAFLLDYLQLFYMTAVFLQITFLPYMSSYHVLLCKNHAIYRHQICSNAVICF